jgi:hypothetical protein
MCKECNSNVNDIERKHKRFFIELFGSKRNQDIYTNLHHKGILLKILQ